MEDDKFLDTADELSRRFGGGTLFVFRQDAPRGFWWDKRIVDQDVLALIEVDVPDAPDSREWLRTYARDVLRARFRPKAIYLKFVGPVEHLIVSEARYRRGTATAHTARPRTSEVGIQLVVDGGWTRPRGQAVDVDNFRVNNDVLRRGLD